MKYERPVARIIEDETVCNESYASGVVAAAAIAVVIVAASTTPVY